MREKYRQHFDLTIYNNILPHSSTHTMLYFQLTLDYLLAPWNFESAMASAIKIKQYHYRCIGEKSGADYKTTPPKKVFFPCGSWGSNKGIYFCSDTNKWYIQKITDLSFYFVNVSPLSFFVFCHFFLSFFLSFCHGFVIFCHVFCFFGSFFITFFVLFDLFHNKWTLLLYVMALDNK